MVERFSFSSGRWWDIRFLGLLLLTDPAKLRSCPKYRTASVRDESAH
jgi:hypothetical protein